MLRKYWLTFAEIGIAAIGLIGWMLSDNVAVALGAAMLMFLFGISKPLIEARRSVRREKLVEKQFDRAQSQLDEQTQQRVSDLPQPSFPFRRLIESMISEKFGENASDQMERYDQAVRLIEAGKTTESIKPFASGLETSLLSYYLMGMDAVRKSELGKAVVHFRAIIDERFDWADAWYCWLFCEFANGNVELVTESNPQLNGIEMQPFAPGDQDSFLALDESERDEQVLHFQKTMRGIGEIYAAAMLELSKEQVSQNRQDYLDAA